MKALRTALKLRGSAPPKQCAHAWTRHKGRYFIKGRLTFYRDECSDCGAIEDRTDPAMWQRPEWWREYDKPGSRYGERK